VRRIVINLAVFVAGCGFAFNPALAEATEPRAVRIAIAQPRNTRFAHLTTKADSRADLGKADSPPRQFQNTPAEGGHGRLTDLKFAHLTTADGLSQDNVIAILQDRRGFMWFGTGDGLNRYDGNGFVVYKNNPNDPQSLSDNFIRDLVEDDRGNLWVAAYPGVNKFDPATERSTRYVHDPNNPNSIGGHSVESIARDSRGSLWLGTSEDGLDRFDPATETFTHYRNDSDGQFVGRITRVIEDSHRDIWFVGERGLFHLNPQTGHITRPPGTINSLSADYVCEDNAGNLWMLAYSPIVGLVKYDRQADRLTKYPLGAGATGIASSKLLDDGKSGFWVPSSLGLYHFDRRTERLTRLFRHDDTDPNSLSDNTVVSIYRDRTGLLWLGTVNGGINILNFQQEEFGRYRHRPADPKSLSAGRVTAIHEQPDGLLWVGFFPRALDRFSRKTGTITHYAPAPNNKNALSEGADINSIYKDSRGYLWLGGWAGGLDRFDEHTGQFKHYGHNPRDPDSLMSDNVLRIYEDRSGRLWVGQFGGVSSFDPATDRFTNYLPDPNNVASLAYSVSAMCQDRSGTLWLGTLSGALSRFDEKTKTFVNYPPDLHDPRKLPGRQHLRHSRRSGWNVMAGIREGPVPAQSAKRDVHPLHGEPGLTQQQCSGDSGR
jgi:ligand-binding sensor domain-containing protein